MTTDTSVPAPAPATCYRHAGRESYIRCTRCDRYICPDCMRSASVGHQCPECVRDGNKTVRQARGTFGGSVVVGTGAPYATIALILLNFAVYAVEVMNNKSIIDLETLGSALAWNGTTFHPVGIAHGEYYRMVSGFFTHSLPSAAPFGIAHILMNMVALWGIGPQLENLLGRARYLALYLLSGLGSSVFVYVIVPHSAAVGASGAIFGLVGAYFVFGQKMGVRGTNQMLLYYVIWLVLSWKYTSWEGHLGGLVTGLTVGAILAYAPRARRELVQWVGLAAVLLVIVGATVVQTSRVHDQESGFGSAAGLLGASGVAVTRSVQSP
jgi:membrane associated rhomboid family serine protease